MTTDERFDRIENSLERIITRFDQRLDQMDQRFDRVDAALRDLNERVDRVERDLGNLTRYFMEFRTEALSRFQAIEARMDIPMSIATNSNSQLSTLTKAMADLGAVSTQLSAAQWKQTDSSFALEARVAKLEQLIAKLQPAA